MLRCRNLHKSFDGRQVLGDVSFDVEDGSIRCLTGASGSGKTTLFRLLLGLERVDSGTITGLPVKGFSAVFQENRLLEHLTPVQNLLAACKGRFEHAEAIKNLACVLPIDCFAQPVSELSGGMKRRVAIVRAVMADSGAIIMDEPFTGLDESSKTEVITYILQERRGRTLLVATHQERDIVLLGAEVLSVGESQCSKS